MTTTKTEKANAAHFNTFITCSLPIKAGLIPFDQNIWRNEKFGFVSFSTCGGEITIQAGRPENLNTQDDKDAMVAIKRAIETEFLALNRFVTDLQIYSRFVTVR